MSNHHKYEIKRLLYSLVIPTCLVLFMWLTKLYETILEVNLSTGGIFPRRAKGLIGIIVSPFLHGSFSHLYANTIPFLILGTCLFYFYKEVASKAFILIYFTATILLWIGGRENYHIGASGIIYGLASFLFFSGTIRKHIPLSAISMVVVFLYGSLFWNAFPLEVNSTTSWEGHLFGGLAGILIAYIYRKEGPQKPEHIWADDDEFDFPEIIDDELTKEEPQKKIIYTYMPTRKEKKD